MKKKALFAVSTLWLWHATRTLPIIKFYLKKWYKIDIISFWNALNFLKEELKNFEINFFEVKDYPPLERWSWIFFYFILIFDLITTYFRILKEKKILKSLEEKYKYDFIFSDWRYGFYSKKTKSYLLSHQLSFEIPKIFAFSQGFMDFFNKQCFKKFEMIFIPDCENKEKNLAWKLSHPKWIKKINHKYIWILSSLNNLENKEKQEKIDFLFTISWYLKEHKENFVEKLLEESKKLDWKKVFILWDSKLKNYYKFDKENNTEIFWFMAWEKKNNLFKNAKTIISRAGYTTIMDLVELEKKAILYPTPNQTEQIYLAKYLWKNNFFVLWDEKKSLENLVLDLEKINIFKTNSKTNSALEEIYFEIK